MKNILNISLNSESDWTMLEEFMEDVFYVFSTRYCKVIAYNKDLASTAILPAARIRNIFA
jgi:hypothetical protein